MAFWKHWRSFVIILAPFVYLPIPLLFDSTEARCGYVVLIMATYWMTEAIHIYATALIPVFAFPLLGVLSTNDAASAYMNGTNMLYLGGLAIAVAVEHCRMHERIALHILITIGTTPERLLLGFMIAMMFLSMWLANTAATAMMVPIVDIVLRNSNPQDESSIESPNDIPSEEGEQLPVVSGNSYEMNNGSTEPSKKRTEVSSRENKPSTNNLRQGDNFVHDIIYLGVAYACNIGGTGSLTGTNPNLILLGFLNLWYGDATGINYGTWIIYNVPVMLIACGLAYLYLLSLIVFHRYRNGESKAAMSNSANVNTILHERLSKLGKFTFHEMVITIMFVILVGLWLSREPQFIAGWGSFISEKFNVQIGGATPAIFVIVLLFALPAKPFWSSSVRNSPNPSPGCLTWDVLQRRLQWGVLILTGGGFAIAEASKTSGLSKWMGSLFIVFSDFPQEWTLVIICFITAALTEVMSNTAVASIFIPILNDMSLSLHVNPLYFLLPMTLCSSYAFMLPVATPPNAIVFDASKGMPVTRMMSIGSVMNLVCIGVVIAMINTYGVYMFELDTFPEWANITRTAN